MPASIHPQVDRLKTNTGTLESMVPEVEKRSDVQVPVCFRRISREEAKTFPHTKQVGAYLVGKMINKGSFAKVMEGLHLLTGEKVAIKVIDKRKAQEDGYILENMRREPRIQQMIKHPNIVQLYETLETENSYYMVMELCLGGDLLDRIYNKQKLEEEEVKKFTRQIVSAVEHLHRHGIVHRDLKIENFLLDENSNIKIIDFGLSNILKLEGLSQELLNTQCGSPAYAAPELLAHKKYGPKVDVWSIGVSMFAMLTGTLPFTVDPFNIKQLHQKMINGEVSSVPPGISSGAVHFMHSLLEPDPGKRPAIKEAMKDKWLNEGFNRKPLSSITYKNRFHPEDLNPLVLNYMADTMELSHTEIISVLISNRPSSIMASYSLLLKKLAKYHKEQKFTKRDNKLIRQQDDDLPTSPDPDAGTPATQRIEDTIQENLKKWDIKPFSRAPSPALLDAIKEDEIAIILENQENLPEVSDSAFKELEPLLLMNQKSLGESLTQSPLNLQEKEDSLRDTPKIKTPHLPGVLENCLAKLASLQAPGLTEFRGESRIRGSSLASQQDSQIKDFPKALAKDTPITAGQKKEQRRFMIQEMEAPQLSLLPRLTLAPWRKSPVKKVSWFGPSQPESYEPSPCWVREARPQKLVLMGRNLRSSREQPRVFFQPRKLGKNLPEPKHTCKATNLSLPLLSPPFQTPAHKGEIFRSEFG